MCMASIVLREVKPLYEGGREVGEKEMGRSGKEMYYIV